MINKRDLDWVRLVLWKLTRLPSSLAFYAAILVFSTFRNAVVVKMLCTIDRISTTIRLGHVETNSCQTIGVVRYGSACEYMGIWWCICNNVLESTTWVRVRMWLCACTYYLKKYTYTLVLSYTSCVVVFAYENFGHECRNQQQQPGHSSVRHECALVLGCFRMGWYTLRHDHMRFLWLQVIFCVSL